MPDAPHSAPAQTSVPEQANLLATPMAIGVAPWTVFHATVTPGYSAPDGSQSAILLCDDHSVHQHDVRQAFGPVIGGSLYSLSCYCRVGSRQWVHLVLWDHGQANSGGHAWFDLSSGTVGKSELFGNGSAHLDCRIEDVGNGWFRCELTCRVSTVATLGRYTAQIQIATHDANVAHQGDGVSGILLWSPHVGRVGTAATALQSPANLLMASNAIGKLPWDPSGTSLGEGYVSPDGDNAAVFLRENGEEAEHGVHQIVAEVLAGQPYTFSCFCKASFRGWVRLVLWDQGTTNSGASAWFDLAHGTLGTVGLFGESAADLVCWMEAVGNGWYRCIVTCVVSDVEAVRGYMAQIQVATTDGGSHYKGDGESGILVWGAQLEQRRIARPLVPTAGFAGDDAVGELTGAGPGGHWLRVLASPDVDVLTYGHNRGGLNNQKLALLGMFLTARRTGVRRIILPEFFSADPNRFSGRAVPFDQVFNAARVAEFAARYDLEVVPDTPPDDEGGWDFFNAASTYISHNAGARNLGPDDFSLDFFRAMEPRITQSGLARRLSETVFAERGIQVALQLRVEIDWVRYTSASLVPSLSEIEEPELSFVTIIRKTQEGLKASEAGVFVTCDEAYLPFGKSIIRDVIKQELGINLVFKSDLLTTDERRQLSRLEMTILDFEMAVSAPFYVGQSRSTFSNLVALERYARSRSPVNNHYIYNLKGRGLGRRTDNGAYAVAEMVIARRKS